MTTMESLKYIYHLPFSERSEFCKIMNQNDKWEELAGKSSEDPKCIQSIYLFNTTSITCYLTLHIKLYFILSFFLLFIVYSLYSYLV